jgi:hypothetical protein
MPHNVRLPPTAGPDLTLGLPNPGILPPLAGLAELTPSSAGTFSDTAWWIAPYDGIIVGYSITGVYGHNNAFGVDLPRLPLMVGKIDWAATGGAGPVPVVLTGSLHTPGSGTASAFDQYFGGNETLLDPSTPGFDPNTESEWIKFKRGDMIVACYGPSTQSPIPSQYNYPHETNVGISVHIQYI